MLLKYYSWDTVSFITYFAFYMHISRYCSFAFSLWIDERTDLRLLKPNLVELLYSSTVVTTCRSSVLILVGSCLMPVKLIRLATIFSFSNNFSDYYLRFELHGVLNVVWLALSTLMFDYDVLCALMGVNGA